MVHKNFVQFKFIKPNNKDSLSYKTDSKRQKFDKSAILSNFIDYF